MYRPSDTFIPVTLKETRKKHETSAGSRRNEKCLQGSFLRIRQWHSETVNEASREKISKRSFPLLQRLDVRSYPQEICPYMDALQCQSTVPHILGRSYPTHQSPTHSEISFTK